VSDKGNKQKRKACLSRYPGQRILIGDSIVIRVSRVEGKRVFVYIETPLNVQVIRPPKEEDTADRDFDGPQKKPGDTE
jgi:hypothetical protein